MLEAAILLQLVLGAYTGAGIIAALLVFNEVDPIGWTALQPLSVSAAGVAIFASGVALAAYPIKLLSRTVILGSLVCIVVHRQCSFSW